MSSTGRLQLLSRLSAQDQQNQGNQYLTNRSFRIEMTAILERLKLCDSHSDRAFILCSESTYTIQHHHQERL
jgi:hypothetical protein